ncbi:MAG: carbohydrate kinase family protein [Candidatus Aenigmarchaeota archaeon]|nr:carbohydrate kinase family protein [Candidatus Aenigmarchaeota archaeon]
MVDVVGMGALNEDIISAIKPGKEEELLKRIKKEGRHHIATYDDYTDYLDFKLRVDGGSAANTITGLAMAGWKCSFISELGNDETAAFIEKQLNKQGIETVIKKVDGKTGSCGIILHADGKYSVLFKEGVSDDIELSDDMLNKVRSCKLFHLSPFASFKSLSSLKTQAALAVEAKKSGVVVSVSPGRLYAETFTSADKTEKQQLAERLLSNSDIIFINKNEARMISGEENHESASQKILSIFNPKIVCITLGSKGCHVRTVDKNFVLETSYAKPVTTLGAGDAFAAGFLDAYLRGNSVEECAKQGNEFASVCVNFIDPNEYLARIKI